MYGLGLGKDVWKVPVDGGSWTKIAGCCVTDIAVDGGYVYGLGVGKDVWKVPVGGGSWANIAGGSVTDIAVHGGYVYGLALTTLFTRWRRVVVHGPKLLAAA